MGHKRKADALSRCPNSGPPEKQSKNYDGVVEIRSETASVRPDNNTIKSLLLELRNVVGELINGAGPIQDQLGEVGRDLLRTASQIERVLAEAKSTHDNHAGESSKAPGKTRRTEDKDTHLPVLPLISDPMLEKAVFKHPGVAKDHEGDMSSLSYDRLEILGDAYVELMATKLIWNRFQNLPSGRISQLREILVKNETLAKFSTLYGFDRRAAVPEDNIKQPKRWTKTKGDIFEAYVAAVILSKPTTGYEEVENWLSQLWSPKLDGFQDTKPTLQSKELLAKKIMGKGIKLKYVDERPPTQLTGGMQTFYVGVYLTGWGWEKQHLGSGQGLNKAIAGDHAAREALLNKPLIDEIAAVKRAYDSEAKAKASSGASNSQDIK
ncbi:hypothetical protein Plec18170_008201 [Paecilomyces lecythidis]